MVCVSGNGFVRFLGRHVDVDFAPFLQERRASESSV